ncbi:MAG TPA: toll/interleukin-1 receptor domain-containing protein, partial [Aminobacteriaceae bacterium]|nr:toll/interleukin-1 receptor domain-containing protein [Aminobacteriaceae bacterium]
MEIKCTKCGAADPMYSKKRGVYVCEECGHEFAREKPFEPRRIFISYGHDEHMALAVRRRDDLRERGHEAWFDEERLQPGHDWEGSIEKGLSWAAEVKPRAAVVLLLTPHSVRRPDGYCLNEVARALALGLRIIP